MRLPLLDNCSQHIHPVFCRLNSSSVADLVAIDKECSPSPWNINLFNGEFDNPCAHVYGARGKGSLVGFLDCHVIVDEAHIMRFGVKPEVRRCGIGRKLLSYTLTDLNETAVRSVWLEVRSSNSIAQSLYHSMGFHNVAIRPGYYTDRGEDAVVMQLDLRHYLDDIASKCQAPCNDTA